MNDELKHWIEDTEAKAAKMNAKAAIMLEAAKRAREGEDPREFVLYAGKPLGRLTGWRQPASTYTLKPKPKLRPWTAKEWGARIGDEFLVQGNRRRLCIVSETYLQFFEQCKVVECSYGIPQSSAIITQLDGSPCGEWSE